MTNSNISTSRALQAMLPKQARTSREAAHDGAQTQGVRPLPEIAHTADGVAFCPADDVWRLPALSCACKFDFREFQASDTVIVSIKHVMIWYAANRSVGTIATMLFLLRRFIKSEASWRGEPVTEITAAVILRYRGTLTPQNDYALGNIGGVLKKWHALKLPGVTDDAVELLSKIAFKHRDREMAVRTMDPEAGPFTVAETTNLQAGLSEARARQDISRRQYVLALLCFAFGPRPIQYAALKVCDVHQLERKGDGATECWLNIPRAKQRGKQLRTDFTPRRAHPHLGHELVQHANEVREAFASILPDPSQAPLFPASRTLAPRPPQFAYHTKSSVITRECSSIFRRLHIVSERTGESLHVFPTRFRRTLGTRAAEAGASPFEIASLLDHSVIHSSEAYLYRTPERERKIDRKLAVHLAPLVNAFKGKVVPGGKTDTGHWIADPRFDAEMRPMGNCAHHGPCNLLVPMHCYTCEYFRPWADGPHERVLEYLLGERERLLQERGSGLAANLDHAILATAEVVQLCEAHVAKEREPDRG